VAQSKKEEKRVTDAEQAYDVARWRKAERERLIQERCLLPVNFRTDRTAVISRELDRLTAERGLKSPTVSVYWPIRGEPDLRPWMRTLIPAGASVALPIALALGEPLIFRKWQPECRMERGLWNIPYPADGEIVTPGIVIAPLVGFDRQSYRLGYGGGFFDRTLAALNPKPFVIGVGYESAELETIFPQPHDIPMDALAIG
jgi:5,10-methenyltetrahydrofolate synthetase